MLRGPAAAVTERGSGWDRPFTAVTWVQISSGTPPYADASGASRPERFCPLRPRFSLALRPRFSLAPYLDKGLVDQDCRVRHGQEAHDDCARSCDLARNQKRLRYQNVAALRQSTP